MKKLSTLLVLLLTMLVGGVNCAYAQDGLLDRASWTVTVSSDCDDSGTGSQGWAEYLKDGDVNTYWHSNWQGTTEGKANGDPTQQLPQFILVDLGEVQDVQTIIYAPRVPGANVNGEALDYEIYTSDEAFDYEQSSEGGSAKKWYDDYAASHTPVAKGAFSYENDGYKTEVWKYAPLPAVQKTRYVMFVIKSSNGTVPNKFANCVEFNIAPSAEAALAFAKKKAQVYYDSEAVAENINETALGYYKQEVIDSWKNELEAATTAEEADAVAFKYYHKKMNLPVSGKLYRIVSGNENFMTKQGVRKVMLSTGDNSFAWNTENHSDVAQYWWFTTEGDGYKIQNVKTGAYIYGSGTTSSTGKKVDLTFAKPGVANFRVADIDARPFHAGGHNQGAGVDGSIISYGTYGSEKSGPSAWIIEDVTLEQAQGLTFPTTYPLTESVNYGGKNIFPVGAYDVEAKKTEFNANMSGISSLEEANTLLRATFPVKPVEIEAGKYYRIVASNPKTPSKQENARDAKYNTLSFKELASSKVYAVTDEYSNSDVNQLWQLVPGENGQYAICNANTKKYVGAPNQAGNYRISMQDEAKNMEVIPFDGTPKFKFHHPGGDEHKCLFAENNNGTDGSKLEGALSVWDSDANGASAWYIIPANDVEVALTQVGEHTYATAHLPFAVSAVEGAKAYTGQLSTAKDYVSLVEAPAFAANEGVVLMGESGQTTATLTIGGEAAKVENAFDGTNEDLTVDETMRETYRVLGVDNTDESEIGFFKPSASLTTIGANRAYLNVASLPAKVKVGFGTVEGISDVIARPELDVNAPIYDLSGRRVLRTVKGGLYIQGGKKVIVK